MRKVLVQISLGLMLMLNFSQVSSTTAQCSMCKTNVKNATESKDKKVGLGINDGILSLVLIPYLSVALVGFIWYRRFRLKRMNESN